MNLKEAAEFLNGSEYGKVGNKSFFEQMKAEGIVVVFGYSDDNAEFKGAIDDEVGCGDMTKIYVTPTGLPRSLCEEGDECPYYKEQLKDCAFITALWCEEQSGFSWTYRTDIPHECFLVTEDGEWYCRGIVFYLKDARKIL